MKPFSSKTERPFWSLTTDELQTELESNALGLAAAEAGDRIRRYGLNSIKSNEEQSPYVLFFSQFKNPIVIILIFASVMSFFLHDITNSIVIFLIILISGTLSFWQEKGAKGAVKKLLEIVRLKAIVMRDGKQEDIAVENIVPGDIVCLSAGDIIPADGLILQSTDLFIDEAVLTGETFPVEKNTKTSEEKASLQQRHNAVFMGTHVISGSARIMIAATGLQTELGKVAKQLSHAAPDTEFETGIRKFGYMLMEITLLLVLIIFAINIYFHRPFVDSLLFSLALAVGLTPQLLPAIISINLSHGAQKMSEAKVIVKRLSSIENFGSMNVLCSDKTGTLTEGEVKVKDFLDTTGQSSDKAALYSYLNSFFESGFRNPIDKAIVDYIKPDINGYVKTGEIPYDFIRKRLSIAVKKDDQQLLILKGAFQEVLEICSQAEQAGGLRPIDECKSELEERFETLSKKGYRIIALAYKKIDAAVTIKDETSLTFLGFIVLFDPPKEGIVKTIQELNGLGISLKMITGDNRYVAELIAGHILGRTPKIMTGKQIRETSNEALLQQVDTVDVFAEMEPNQKEHVLVLLKKRGYVVGYMGDGINDASALHVADVGISVDTAVDVAKESADIVLLDKNLDVLIAGVKEGRKTFANTMKYIYMATSANFGNMFSMAGISIFLPFLPLLPVQILLMNLLTDFPEMTIATDRVDEDLILQPRRWDISLIKRFMIVFGLLSSLFDFITFGVLILLLQAGELDFRTGWFVESVISASLVVLMVRTSKSVFKSRPGKYLTIAVSFIVLLAMAIPYTPLGKLLGFVPVSASYLLAITGIVVFYIISTEIVKHFFYKRFAQ